VILTKISTIASKQLCDFSELISSKSEEYLEIFMERLEKLRNKASGIGWGYGDTVDEVISELLKNEDN
jgi:hypothetical protein